MQNIIFLPVKDIDKTSGFYTKVIGLKLYKSQAEGKCLIFDSGYGYIGFSEIHDDRVIPSGDKGVCISFNHDSTAEVDRKFAELSAMGIKTDTEPKLIELFGVYSFFLRDPDDYKVEIQALIN